jgi:hypothetical protein
MTPGEILSGCSRDGIELRLTNDGMIRYSGDEYSLKYWLPILAAHKTSVVAELSLEPFTPELEIIRCCQDCRHFARPGLIRAGYCGQRQRPAAGLRDQPPAAPTCLPTRAKAATNTIAGDWVQP